jgi:hypothetical protein
MESYDIGFEFNPIPRQMKNLPPSHPRMIGHQIHGLEMQARMSVKPGEIFVFYDASRALFSFSIFIRLPVFFSTQPSCTAPP